MGCGNRIYPMYLDKTTELTLEDRLQFDQPVQSTLLNAITRMGQFPGFNLPNSAY